MSRQAKKVTPRWRKKPAPPSTMITVKGPAARHLSRALVAKAVADAAIKDNPVHRYRKQLIPVWWGVTVIVISLILRAFHLGTVRDVIAGIVAALGIILVTRHLDNRWTRRATLIGGILTGLFGLLLVRLGPSPWLPLYAGWWAVFGAIWAYHYRFRPDAPKPGPSRHEEIWAQLSEHMHWVGHLGEPEKIPNGVRYPLVLDGIKTHIGKVLAEPVAIAAAFDSTITEAYVEPSPDGKAKRGSLTLLRTGNLQEIRYWDGAGVTPDGFARIARFADGSDARKRVFAPMDGTRHSLIAGTTGAGKSALLDLLLHIYLSCGFIFPIVLDPQEGQSLPDWQDAVPYAAGAEQCLEMLELIHQLMYARSRQLGRMTWNDDGHIRRMSFFDHVLTGWPLIMVIADEAHILLSDQLAIERFKDIGKLGRKTGVGVDLVTQVPSLEELGSQTLRSMLRGGNVICLRTADHVSAGMLGLPADPADLPQYFPGGDDFTYGLCYIIGPDRRQAVARTDIPTKEQRRRRYNLPELEPAAQAILDRFGSNVPLLGGTVTQRPAIATLPVDDRPAPGGQTPADAVLAVLAHRMTKGDIIIAAQDLSVEWGRTPAFTVASITAALAQLVASRAVVKTGDGYDRASLHLVTD